MKIGLIRHFKVMCDEEEYMTSSEFENWSNAYDQADVMLDKVTINLDEWDICYSSNMKRAIQTGKHLYKGEITYTDLIKEVPIGPIMSTQKKYSYRFWLLFGRFAWLLSHRSQIEKRRDTEKRVRDFLVDLIKDDKNKLVITHGYVMRVIQKELIGLGFKGKKFKKAENGRLYVFEK